MANDAYCDDSYLQAQQEQEEQEYQLWLFEQDEHNQYLEILANDLYGSSITLMIEFN